MTLNKAQIKYLRKLAQKEKAIFQMGKLGLTPVFIQQVQQALAKRELVKFSILQNSEETIDEVSQVIADQVQAEIVQVIGHTCVLYRQADKEKYRQISQTLTSLK